MIMKEISEKRFSFKCDLEGRVSEILQNDDNILSPSIIGNMFFSSIATGDLDKILNFFIELKREKVAIGWEINISMPEGAKTFSFFGGVFEGIIGIVAATTKSGAKKMFNELTRINNEQANIIRSLAKENEKLQINVEEPAVSYYEELSRLNNELVNMQRELAKKNIELDELNKLKNEFLGIAAHDLRNPLGIIMGYSNSFLDKSESSLSDVQKMMMESILTSSQFMLGLLDELLDISAIESGKVKLDLVRADLVSLISKNVEMNNFISLKKNVGIHFNCSQKIPQIIFDISKIEQVLNNLLSNAVKFSFPGTSVNVSVVKNDNSVIVSVADNGQGIPSAELGNLFKPFKNISVKSTAGEKSTGLGLSIVHNLITAHKGELWVESVDGKGSTFYFSLPCT
jgi:signal transduction histidine kinase